MLESRDSNFSTKRNSIAGKNFVQSSTVSLKLSPNSPAGCSPKMAKTTVNSPFIEVTFKKVKTQKKFNKFVLPSEPSDCKVFKNEKESKIERALLI